MPKKTQLAMKLARQFFFCVSRAHCRIMTKLLNEEASKLYPEQYGSGSFFALQITSDIMGSQDRTTRFSNNDLNGHSSFNPELFDYESSKREYV
jgi:hypothetical protein